MIRITTFLILTVLTTLLGTANAQFTVLHSFAGGPDDGELPIGNMTNIGSTLYGMTNHGGTTGIGTVFKIDTDGTDFGLLRSFGTTADDGGTPFAGLISDGSTLYGANNGGTAFKIGADGTGFSPLKTGLFLPHDLLLAGSTLYGTTSFGGDEASGSVYKVDADGTDYLSLHSFNAANNSMPRSGLTLVGSTLYGTTYRSGFQAPGSTVFKIDTDGTDFDVLHTFDTPGDGRGARFGLTSDGLTLYGVTESGGTHNLGTVFKINIDGTGYDALYDFGGLDGNGPGASLLLAGSTLYGTTFDGGTNNLGTVFRINTDGTGFDPLCSFAGGPNDGAGPLAGLTLVGSTLYGTTSSGGTNEKGTIFALTVPEPSGLALGLSAFVAGILFLPRLVRAVRKK